MRDLGWWVISGAALMDALERARAGEDPGLLYAELYANTERAQREDPEPVVVGHMFKGGSFVWSLCHLCGRRRSHRAHSGRTR